MNPPKIFISATSGDLSGARQIAKEALLTINCHPVEQTNFEPDWRSVTDMLRGKIGDCQALIHLVGFRYGAEPDPATLPGGTPRRSYTQMEYHLARELGLRVYTFLLPETYPFDVPAKADPPEQTQLQAAHRALIQSSPHLYEKPANDLVLRTRIIALQEQVIRLEREQQSIAKEVKTTRHWGVWAAAAILLILGGIGVWQWQTKKDATAIVTGQKDLATQMTQVQEALSRLQQNTDPKQDPISKWPQERVEKELAQQMNFQVEDLRALLTAGKISLDALVAGQALLASGKQDEAGQKFDTVIAQEQFALQRLNQAYVGKAQIAYDQAKYEEALDFRQKAVALVDKAAAPIAWARAQGEVAFILHPLARYKEAEPLLREVLRLREQHLGLSHPETAIALNNLAMLLHNTDRMEEAEPLMRLALDFSEISYGPDDPDVATKLSNLAGLLKDTNRFIEAESLMRRALKILEASYGPNHPEVARAMNNLARLLQSTNQMKEVEPLMRRALKIFEGSYEADHPEVSTALFNLARLLYATNQMKEAEPLMRRALKIAEATFGPDHPTVAINLNALALLLQGTNRMQEAEPLMRRALKIDEANLGQHHTAVGRDLSILALFLRDANRLEEAEPMMQRALKIVETSYGPDHPQVATALNNLALVLGSTNRQNEAELLFRRALKIDEASYGPIHPDVARDLNNLAAIFFVTNRLREAEPLHRRALSIDEATFGPDHPCVARDLNNLARLCQDLGRLEEAESLSRRSVKILVAFRRSTAHEHPDFRKYLAVLHGLLTDLKLTEEQINTKLRDVLGPELAPTFLGPFHVTITEVIKGGQGEALGLRAGDVYASYNVQAVTSAEQFLSLVSDSKGEAIPMEILRGGKKLTLTAKPGKFGTRIENRPIPPTGAEPAK